MSIKAKFKCTAVTDYGASKKAEMHAVYGNEGENADYSRFTPSGQLSITVDQSTKAADFFEPDQEYYLTFEKA